MIDAEVTIVLSAVHNTHLLNMLLTKERCVSDEEQHSLLDCRQVRFFYGAALTDERKRGCKAKRVWKVMCVVVRSGKREDAEARS